MFFLGDLSDVTKNKLNNYINPDQLRNPDIYEIPIII
jgi:hypothetical protein